MTVPCERDDVSITVAVKQSPFWVIEVERNMQDEKALETGDAARMHAWLEGVGGNVFIGEGKLKSVKISRKGNKLRLVIKKGKKKDKIANQTTTA